MKRFEYIRIEVDMGDLGLLNQLGGQGWEAVGFASKRYLLLKRELETPPPSPFVQGPTKVSDWGMPL
jgi:hypothetical protein